MIILGYIRKKQKYFKALQAHLIVLISLSFVASCVSPGQFEDVAVPTENTVITFGKVTILENGEVQELGKQGSIWSYGSGYWLILLRTGESEPRTYRISDTGYFFWALEPGDYRVVNIINSRGGNYSALDVWADFAVPEGADGIYLGTLVVATSKRRYKVSTLDEFESAELAIRQEIPALGDDLRKLILKPGLNLGTFSKKIPACSALWMIDCPDRHIGTVPIYPPIPKRQVISDGFSDIETLTPIFEWKGSSAPYITYDLVVFEAIGYAFEGIEKRHVPGRILAYHENLRSPTFQLAEPLKPERKYFWSVRFRKKDIISHWSRYGYFSFFLLGWTSGEGLWFAFETK